MNESGYEIAGTSDDGWPIPALGQQMDPVAKVRVRVTWTVSETFHFTVADATGPRISRDDVVARAVAGALGRNPELYSVLYRSEAGPAVEIDEPYVESRYA